MGSQSLVAEPIETGLRSLSRIEISAICISSPLTTLVICIEHDVYLVVGGVMGGEGGVGGVGGGGAGAARGTRAERSFQSV